MPDLQATLFRLVPEDGSAIGNERIAVKIVDDRGIESLKVMDLD